MINYQKELNPEQLAVVQNGDGYCLVLAGAGSGKTRAVTYRVAYLLEKGVKPENILLVTFTNKAADEMISRVQKLVSGLPLNPPLNKRGTASEANFDNMGTFGLSPSICDTKVREVGPTLSGPLPNRGANMAQPNILEGVGGVNLPWSGTFHHIANKILRKYAAAIQYENNFTILDSDDSEQMLKKLIKEFKTENKFPSAKVINNLISFSRNSGEPLNEVIYEKAPQWAKFTAQIITIADAYSRDKKAANVMDFDDLLINFLLLLQNPDIKFKLANQFEYVLVDEYQDTNRIQAQIVDALSGVHKNLLVVGDDAQSIYSFRAADIDNILKFEEKYPDTKIFKLETNYRSGEEILNLANSVIANNTRQYQKNLHTLKKHNTKPKLSVGNDKEHEAEIVVKKIVEFLRSGGSPRELAVLFRASHHSQPLELELMRHNIPYEYRGGLRFFERAHIKDVLCYLRIMNNWADAAAWTRVLLHEEGLGPVAVSKIVGAIQQMENIGQLRQVGDMLGEKARAGWNNFLKIWDTLAGQPKKPAEMLVVLLDSPYRDYLETEHVDADERLEDLEQMSQFATKYNDLESFLAETALHESFQRPQSSSPFKGRAGVGSRVSEHKDSIILSTIHQAKGLEWESVFVINLVAGAFPSDRSLNERDGLEEERRLFYVAITRAKKDLNLSYSQEGSGWACLSGRQGGAMGGPSLFLDEIEPELLDGKLNHHTNLTILNDHGAGVTYEPDEDDVPFKSKARSFLRGVDEL